ncbi:MAG TPA: hypothetical protein VEC35_23390 [Noviherbaspirillum sp.]|nr:hypothetical protein [Noviherbaspirillum sp.]
MKTDDGTLIVISGTSRTGKSVYTERQVRSDRRVFVWDPEDQWSKLRGYQRVTKRAELVRLADKPGQMKVAYVASANLKAEFDFFCHCAFHWGRFHGGGVVVAEELADVTTTAKAPDGWGILIRRGLKRGITIYCISQRWAEADKTAFGNAKQYVCFMSSSADDVAYLSRKTRIPQADLDGLLPLQYIRFEPGKPLERGKIKF